MDGPSRHPTPQIDFGRSGLKTQPDPRWAVGPPAASRTSRLQPAPATAPSPGTGRHSASAAECLAIPHEVHRVGGEHPYRNQCLPQHRRHLLLGQQRLAPRDPHMQQSPTARRGTPPLQPAGPSTPVVSPVSTAHHTKLSRRQQRILEERDVGPGDHEILPGGTRPLHRFHAHYNSTFRWIDRRVV